MKKYEIEPPLTHALDKNGDLKYVRDVPIGDACGCICPKCKEPLIAKHCYNEGKLPHFAHESGKVCIGAQMSGLHLKAQQIIVENLYVKAPEYRRIKSRQLRFVKAKTEDTRWDGVRPDVVGEDADGNIWAVEIFYTNKVNYLKEDKIKNLNISCLEIDITDQTFESLESFLLDSYKNRWWINNPIYDKRIYEEDRALVKAVTAALLLEEELVIPKYNSISRIRLFVTSISLVSMRSDGFRSFIKLISSDNNVYYFIVGSSELINSLDYNLIISRFPNSNVLSVCTDDYFKSGYKFSWIVGRENKESEKKNISILLDEETTQPVQNQVVVNVDNKNDDGKIIIPEHQETGGENGIYSKPLICDSLEDFYFYIEKKRIINWNGNDNHVENFILSGDRTELYVMHYYTRDLCYLIKFTWQKFNYYAETKSGSYEDVYNDLKSIKEKMNAC